MIRLEVQTRGMMRRYIRSDIKEAKRLLRRAEKETDPAYRFYGITAALDYCVAAAQQLNKLEKSDA